MFLKELEIQNFGIIGETCIAFNPLQRVVGLVGRYTDEAGGPVRSNRAGKTTLIEAQRYLLFGTARVRSHLKLINRAALARGEGMKVRGVFVFGDGREIEIVRTRAPDGAPGVSVTGFEGSGWEGANRYIEGLIGFSFDEYQNTAYFGQGQIHAFMNSEPREKRDLLLAWLNQSRWDTRREYAKARASKWSMTAESIDRALSAMGTADDLPALRKRLVETKAAEVTARSEVVLRKKIVEDLEAEFNASLEQATLKKRRKELGEQVARAERRLEEAEAAVAERIQIRARLAEIEGELSAARTSERGELSALSEALGKVQAEAAAARRLADNVRGAAGTCPVLSEACSRVGKTAAGAATEAAVVADNAVAVARKAAAEAVKRNRGVLSRLETEQEALDRRLRELPAGDPADLGAELDRLDGLLSDVAAALRPEVRESSVVQWERNEARGELTRAATAAGAAAEAVKAAEREIIAAETREEKRKELREQLDAAKKNLAAWTYCIFMFGTRGIPGDYIKGAFADLETDVNYLLHKLGTALSVEFKPYRSTDVWEKSCLACGSEYKPRGMVCSACGEARQRKQVEQLVLTLRDGLEGRESEFELDSGGGQTLISFAVRLALLFLKIRENKGEVPPIILDEIAGALDGPNRAAVINVVLNTLTGEYGVNQVFWISHTEEIVDSVDNVLAVTRSGDHSVVDWE